MPRPPAPDRRAALRLAAMGAALGALGACGFSPVYAPGAPATVLRNAIRPDPPANATQLAFATRIEERFGTASAPRFRLAYGIAIRSQGLAVTPSLSTLRYNLSGRATYRVLDIQAGTVLTRGRFESFASYSAIGTTVATRASRQDAEERLGVILADGVAAQLIGSAEAWAP